MLEEERNQGLSQKSYALLPAFLRGMLDGAGPGTHITDGNESAYYYTKQEQYFDSYLQMAQGGLYLIDPEQWGAYRERVLAGQALYVDQYYGLRQEKVLGNFMTPEQQAQWFEHNVYWALETTDKYVWCYSERMNWWKNESVPAGSEQAIVSARAKVAAGQPLGFDLAPVVASAEAREKEAQAARFKKRAADIARLPGDVPIPVIDGKLDDAAWQRLTALDEFVPLASMSNALKADTRVCVAWNQDGLYLAFRCAEPDVTQIKSVGKDHDADIFGGDVVEMFFAPEGVSGPVYHFAVNPAGVFWDAVHGAGGETDLSYNPQWACAAATGTDGWTAEAIIPWAALKMQPPAAGAMLLADLFRERAAGNELSAWSPTARLFLEPEHFGTWTLK
jgi:hypothetical protein